MYPALLQLEVNNAQLRKPVGDARIVGATNVAARDAWVLWYVSKPVDTDGLVYRTEWISKDTFRLVRRVAIASEQILVDSGEPHVTMITYTD